MKTCNSGAARCLSLLVQSIAVLILALGLFASPVSACSLHDDNSPSSNNTSALTTVLSHGNHCTVPGCVSTAVTIPAMSGRLGIGKALVSPPLSAVGAAGVVTTTTVLTYTYDPLSRLTDAAYSNGQRFQYAYDEVGNRTTQTATITSTQTTAYQYDAANRLTNVNGQAYAWDDNGNLVNDGNTAYAYDQANRLISATLGTTSTQYAYNGDGARLRQIVNGLPTVYTLDLAVPLVQVLAMQDAGSTTAYEYGLTRIGEQQSTGWAYHLSDVLGSVRQLVDTEAKVTLARGYTPYGESLWSQGTGQSVYGFTGEALDTYTKLLFLRARYTQPTLGMFLSHDPWSGDEMQPGSMNGYSYAEGNPTNRTDPSGRCSLHWETLFQGPDIICTVNPREDFQKGLYQIAREYRVPQQHLYETFQHNITVHPPTWNPSLIHFGDLIFIPKQYIDWPPPPSEPPQPPGPLDDVPQPPSGFLQPGWLVDGVVVGASWTAEYPHDGSAVLMMPQAPCGVVGGGTGSEEVYDLAHNEYAVFHYDFAIYNENFTPGGALTAGTYTGLMNGLSEYGVEGYKDYSVCHQVSIPSPLGIQIKNPLELGAGMAICGPHPGPNGLVGVPTVDFSRQGVFSFLVGADLTASAVRVSTPTTIYAKYSLQYKLNMDEYPSWKQAWRQYATGFIGQYVER